MDSHARLEGTPLLENIPLLNMSDLSFETPYLPSSHVPQMPPRRSYPSPTRQSNIIDVLALSSKTNHLPNKRVSLRERKSSLVVRNIPKNLNSFGPLEKHFSKFGTIINIKVSYEGDPKLALVQFSHSSEATAAYRSPEPIMNNRFISLFWPRNSENEIPFTEPPKPHTSCKVDSDGHINEQSTDNNNNAEMSTSVNCEPNDSTLPLSLRKQPCSGIKNVSPKVLQMIENERKALCQSVHNQNLLLKKLETAKTTKERQNIKKLLKEGIGRQGGIKPTIKMMDILCGDLPEDQPTGNVELSANEWESHSKLEEPPIYTEVQELHHFQNNFDVRMNLFNDKQSIPFYQGVKARSAVIAMTPETEPDPERLQDDELTSKFPQLKEDDSSDEE